MAKRAMAAGDQGHVDAAARVAAARTEQLASIRQTAQPRRRRTEQQLKVNLETAEAAGVTWAPYYILDELKFWSHWLQRADWQPPQALKELSLHVEPLDEDEEIAFDRPERVDFTWQGTRFNIVQRESNFGEFAFAQVTVDVEWVEVMDLTLTAKAEGEPPAWRVCSVDTLRAGEWMAKLADLGGLIRVEQERGRQKAG